MTVIRFQLQDGRYTDALIASDGPFAGGNTKAAQDLTVARSEAALSLAYGQPVHAVVADKDPWDGVAALVQSPAAAQPKPITKTLDDRVATIEQQLGIT